ncbi:MAG: TlpA family protein disulfide reductase [Prevotella sp.]|nr:TlpA family protein disulfide reductase [Prevotella sp.]
MNRTKAIVAALLFSATAALAQNNQKFTFSGHLTDVNDSLEIWAVTVGENDFGKFAQIPCEKGKFSFTTDIDKAKSIQFFIPLSQQRANGNRMLVRGLATAIPGEHLNVEGKLEDFTFGGSKIYQDYNEVNKIFTAANKRSMKFYETYTATIKADSTKKDEAMATIRKANEASEAQTAAELMQFVRANGNNEAVALAINSLAVDSIPVALKLISADVRNGRLGVFIESAEQRYKSKVMKDEAKKKVAPGKQAPDFTLNDINGKPFTLSSLRGKYVVLDFWGSWCGWCIKGMPDMKKYYEKYSGKFEIVGIDCKDTEAKWKDAVAKQELPWIHVKSEKADATPQKYAIEGYPTKIIVNPDGTIHKVIIGEDPAFYKELDSLFGAK